MAPAGLHPRCRMRRGELTHSSASYLTKRSWSAITGTCLYWRRSLWNYAARVISPLCVASFEVLRLPGLANWPAAMPCHSQMCEVLSPHPLYSPSGLHRLKVAHRVKHCVTLPSVRYSSASACCPACGITAMRWVFILIRVASSPGLLSPRPAQRLSRAWHRIDHRLRMACAANPGIYQPGSEL